MGVVFLVRYIASPQMELKQSDPVAAVTRPIVENFKHNARRIGADTFPSPKISEDQITRAPATNSSSYDEALRQKRKHRPVFLMSRPLVQNITTIVSGNKTVTIAGIIPRPIDETCMVNGEARPCGRLARTALRALIRGRTLKCDAVAGSVDDGSITTSCKIGNTDIAGWLIKQGWTKPQAGLTGQSK